MNAQKIYGHLFPLVSERLKRDLHNLLSKGIQNVEGRHCVTGYSFGELFDWDMYFENLALSYFGISEYCKSGIECFLDRQKENGFISRTLGVKWPKDRQHFKPFIAQTALLFLKQTGETLWLLQGYYEKMKRYLDYWLSEEYDSNKNGLPVWNSADHSGMDNQDERGGSIDSYICEGVDLAVFLVREYEAMAKLSEAISKDSDCVYYRTQSNELKKKISEVFWDEKDGFFYDINVRTGQFIKCKTVAGFSPLWVGAATQNQAKRLVEEHLLNTDEFWLEFPVASMSKLEPGYRQEKYDYETCCNWKGTCWIPSNYYVFHGLIKYGFKKVAGELAEKTLKMLLKNDNTREYYNAETGDGLGLNPFWGWSILGYFMLLEYETGYFPSEPDTQYISHLWT
ncbi:MAG: trehalase family glycosidase [Clostridia bacterium]|nr:trehalase family glycosidase [Clostridia bacterium]